MTTSQSWWMLKTLRSSTFRLRMPHRLPLPSASLARQWSFWRCVWGRYHVGILPCGPDSEGRGSCSASVCHSKCWHSWFPQWTVAPQCRQHSCSPPQWHSHHHAWLYARHTCLCTLYYWSKYVYLGLIRPQNMVPVIHVLSPLVFSKLFAGFLLHHL